MWSAASTVSWGRRPRHSRDLSGARRPAIPHHVLPHERGFRRRMIDRFAADSITLSRRQGIRLPGVLADARQPVLITLPPRYPPYPIHLRCTASTCQNGTGPRTGIADRAPTGKKHVFENEISKRGFFWKTSFYDPSSGIT